MYNTHSDSLPVWAIILLVLVLASQSMWLFRDARRRHKNYWFWGILGLTQCPTPLVAYWYIHIYRPWKKAKQEEDSQN